VSGSPVLVVSNRISLLTTLATSSTGTPVETVTVTFPTIEKFSAAWVGTGNPIALAANHLMLVRVAEWQTR
jgi:hypothetical protein